MNLVEEELKKFEYQNEDRSQKLIRNFAFLQRFREKNIQEVWKKHKTRFQINNSTNCDRRACV